MTQNASSCGLCGKKTDPSSLSKCKACGKKYCPKCQSPSSNQKYCIECVNMGGVVKH
ncbi:MAG: hypothetical protein KKG47_02330 [Proteobacteria bacterium]|nr:hypothetical protein [Pseudomonadota bacterium]MBU1737416.1 hypothetical protein [Pseudomonadota bacterium]